MIKKVVDRLMAAKYDKLGCIVEDISISDIVNSCKLILSSSFILFVK